MDSPAVLDLLLTHLEESELSAGAELLVLAAYQGSDELQQALEGVTQGDEPDAPVSHAAAVPRNYIKSISVTSFRGVGERAALQLQPGPGLTLVVGRNGSGKSSFAEAAEVALTGRISRWKDRSKVWREGWQNLHTEDPPEVSIELVVDGEPGTTKVVRTWAGDDVEQSSATSQRHGEARQELKALGFTEAVVTFRPFLSYADLGTMLQGKPTELYDMLHSILGLDGVAAAQVRLKGKLKDLDEAANAATAEQRRLLMDLESVEDPRARAAAKALSRREPDLAAVAEILRSPVTADEDVAALRAWTGLPVPDAHAATAAAERLSSAHDRAGSFQGTESGKARQLGLLLEQALEHAEHSTSEDCPVCGSTGKLDASWRLATIEEVARLRTLAAEADEALTSLRRAKAAAVDVAPMPPSCLSSVPSGVPGAELGLLWGSWAEAVRSDDVAIAAAALTSQTPIVASAAVAAVEAANAELARREDKWAPVAELVTSWLVDARTVASDAGARSDLKAAAEWLKGETNSLRNERLAPVAEQAAKIWERLRQESNVELGPVRLAGTATQRRVELDVTVDGVDGAALGVMSQGELHALALSIFLPRAMLTDSPFRFLIIDDPVQAMDPAKVDGLAQVLADVAETHQVVVFTHDDRLPESVRRLQVPATIWQVVRRERSMVELTKASDPIARYLDDATALANSSELSPAVAGRVVPGLCRGAIEAACQEVYRSKRLKEGRGHFEVEDALQAARTTNELAALALFEDASRGGEVMSRLNTFGRWAGDAFKACRSGVHTAYGGDLKALVRDAETLTSRLRS